MNRFNNEHGAALILVLFIITFMTLLIPTLFYQLNQSTTQYSKMESDIQYASVEEMGMDFFKSHVEAIVNTDAQIDLSYIQQTIFSNQTIDVNQKLSFVISLNPLVDIEERDEGFVINFEVMVVDDGLVVKEASHELELTVNKMGDLND